MNKQKRIKMVKAMEYITEYYTEDEHFADLMDTFLWCMEKACKSGGLYCNGIVSK